MPSHFPNSDINASRSLCRVFKTSDVYEGDPKIPGIVKKNVFKIVVQVRNFIPPQSTAP